MPGFDYVKTKRKDVHETPAKNQKLLHQLMKFYTLLNVWVFKVAKGRLWRNFPGGFPICVIGMKGRKSGTRREVALIHLPYKDSVLLVASKAGMSTNPAWYYNVKTHSDVDVLFNGETRKLVARQVSDDEKRKLWPHLLSLYPDFDEYRRALTVIFRCLFASLNLAVQAISDTCRP